MDSKFTKKQSIAKMFETGIKNLKFLGMYEISDIVRDTIPANMGVLDVRVQGLTGDDLKEGVCKDTFLAETSDLKVATAKLVKLIPVLRKKCLTFFNIWGKTKREESEAMTGPFEEACDLIYDVRQFLLQGAKKDVADFIIASNLIPLMEPIILLSEWTRVIGFFLSKADDVVANIGGKCVYNKKKLPENKEDLISYLYRPRDLYRRFESPDLFFADLILSALHMNVDPNTNIDYDNFTAVKKMMIDAKNSRSSTSSEDGDEPENLFADEEDEDEEVLRERARKAKELKAKALREAHRKERENLKMLKEKEKKKLRETIPFLPTAPESKKNLPVFQGQRDALLPNVLKRAHKTAKREGSSGSSATLSGETKPKRFYKKRQSQYRESPEEAVSAEASFKSKIKTLQARASAVEEFHQWATMFCMEYQEKSSDEEMVNAMKFAMSGLENYFKKQARNAEAEIIHLKNKFQ